MREEDILKQAVGAIVNTQKGMINTAEHPLVSGQIKMNKGAGISEADKKSMMEISKDLINNKIEVFDDDKSAPEELKKASYQKQKSIVEQLRQNSRQEKPTNPMIKDNGFANGSMATKGVKDISKLYKENKEPEQIHIKVPNSTKKPSVIELPPRQEQIEVKNTLQKNNKHNDDDDYVIEVRKRS